MIRSFRHKGLSELYTTDRTRKIRPDLVQRVRKRLDALDRAETLDDLRLPGFDLHPLHGKPVRHSIKVNGPWRVTFEWVEADGDAHRVDLEQYH
ncbi:MAG: type II toxin-antitoxin system RelE/ParE family toxin [Thermoanaerobaculia bacterium]